MNRGTLCTPFILLIDVGQGGTGKQARRDDMKKFIFKPDITLYSGVQVFKDTKLEYKNDNVDQKLENLVLEMTTYTKENNYEVRSNLTFHLNEGDILLYDEEVGYQVPRVPMSTLKDALTDIEALQDFDKEV